MQASGKRQAKAAAASVGAVVTETGAATAAWALRQALSALFVAERGSEKLHKLVEVGDLAQASKQEVIHRCLYGCMGWVVLMMCGACGSQLCKWA